MGRLIEADNLKRYIIETYHDPIIVCNDDEVHFVAEIIDDYPTIEAIPKDKYENRLKADMVAMLKELKKEIAKLKSYESADGQDLAMLADIGILLNQKIDKLREGEL